MKIKLMSIFLVSLVFVGFYFYHSSDRERQEAVSLIDTQEVVSLNKPSYTQAQVFKFPLYFEKNEGQVDSLIKYLAKGQGYTFYFSPQEIVMVLQKVLKEENMLSSAVLKIQFVGARKDPLVKGLEEQEYKVNYFIGNDPEKWRPRLPTFAKVYYEGLYPGIDAVFYGCNQQFEYDVYVAPGADPYDIRLRIEGIKKLAINSNGALCMYTEDEQELQMQKPIVYQMINQEKIFIEGSFVLLADNEVGFSLGAYDKDRLLVIDPVLKT